MVILAEYDGDKPVPYCECRKCMMRCYVKKFQPQIISYSDIRTYNFTPLKNSPNFLSFLQVDNSFFTPWNWNPNPNPNPNPLNYEKHYMSFEDGSSSFFENFDGFKYNNDNIPSEIPQVESLFLRTLVSKHMTTSNM